MEAKFEKESTGNYGFCQDRNDYYSLSDPSGFVQDFNMPTYNQGWSLQQELQSWDSQANSGWHNQHSWQELGYEQLEYHQTPEFESAATEQQHPQASFEEILMEKVDMLLGYNERMDQQFEEQSKMKNLSEEQTKANLWNRCWTPTYEIMHEDSSADYLKSSLSSSNVKQEVAGIQQEERKNDDENSTDKAAMKFEKETAEHNHAELATSDTDGIFNDKSELKVKATQEQVDDKKSQIVSLGIVTILNQEQEPPAKICLLETIFQDSPLKSTQPGVTGVEFKGTGSEDLELLDAISEMIEDWYIDVEMEVAQEMDATFADFSVHITDVQTSQPTSMQTSDVEYKREPVWKVNLKNVQELGLISKVHIPKVEHFAMNEGFEDKKKKQNNTGFGGQKYYEKNSTNALPSSNFWAPVYDRAAKWCKGYANGQRSGSHKWKQKCQQLVC